VILYCKKCHKPCSNEIPEEKEEQYLKEWEECPLCVDCIIGDKNEK